MTFDNNVMAFVTWIVLPVFGLMVVMFEIITEYYTANTVLIVSDACASQNTAPG